MIGNTAKVSQRHFADDGVFPNSRLPLIVYQEAVAPEEATPEALEQLFDANGWPSQWRDSIYDYDHYHSTAHETLGIAIGEARIAFGGPAGEEIAVKAGDVVAIPAGVAHRLVTASDGFLVVGAYPPGGDWDVLKGEPGERPEADERIARLGIPQTDPVGGAGGPLLRAWG